MCRLRHLLSSPPAVGLDAVGCHSNRPMMLARSSSFMRRSKRAPTEPSLQKHSAGASDKAASKPTVVGKVHRPSRARTSSAIVFCPSRRLTVALTCARAARSHGVLLAALQEQRQLPRRRRSDRSRRVLRLALGNSRHRARSQLSHVCPFADGLGWERAVVGPVGSPVRMAQEARF